MLVWLKRVIRRWCKPKGFIGYASDGRAIVLPSVSKIEKYNSHVEQVLEGFGHPEAMVTDLSSASDFLYEIVDVEPYIRNGREITKHIVSCDPGDLRLQNVADKLGLDKIGPEERIWEIAKRLKKSGEID